MAPYAAETSVPIAKTKMEIETMIAKYGASRFASATEGAKATIMFEIKNRRVRFSITVPQGADRKSEQQARAMWRALFLSVKAKLVSVESKIETFEEAFLAHIVMPDNRTVAQHTGKAIADAYAEGRMNRPLLLEGPR